MGYRMLPKSSRHTFEGDAARIILSPNQVTKLEATLLSKLELGNSLIRFDYDVALSNRAPLH